jgi:hypothetical protein
MNKILAIVLPLIWLLLIFLEDTEYKNQIRFLMGAVIGLSSPYLWLYYGLRDELLKQNKSK